VPAQIFCQVVHRGLAAHFSSLTDACSMLEYSAHPIWGRFKPGRVLAEQLAPGLLCFQCLSLRLTCDARGAKTARGVAHAGRLRTMAQEELQGF